MFTICLRAVIFHDSTSLHYKFVSRSDITAFTQDDIAPYNTGFIGSLYYVYNMLIRVYVFFICTRFPGVLDFLESFFIFKAWKLLEFCCFCYNVLEFPWKHEKHRTFFKLIVLNYLNLFTQDDIAPYNTVFIANCYYVYKMVIRVYILFTRNRIGSPHVTSSTWLCCWHSLWSICDCRRSWWAVYWCGWCRCCGCYGQSAMGTKVSAGW